MATSSELLFRDLLNEPMHFCLARLERIKKQTLYYLIIKYGGVITGAQVDASSHTIILVADSDTRYSNYISGVPIFKASYINECIRAKRILDISQFLMSHIFIADENLNYMDVVYERKYEWTTLLPSIKDNPNIEIQPSRSHEDSLSTTPTRIIQSQPASTILAQGDTSLTVQFTEAEIRSMMEAVLDDEIRRHPRQFQRDKESATPENLLMQHYVAVNGADFYSACCFCSVKCSSSQNFRMHKEQCEFKKLWRHHDDQYWNKVENLCYSEQYSKLAFNYLKLLLRKSKKKRTRVVVEPPHMIKGMSNLEYIWRLTHCALAKWAETDPKTYDEALLKLDKGDLDFALSLIPSTVFSIDFKTAIIENYSVVKCPENLSRKILQPCYYPDCMHPYSAAMDLDRLDDESESSSSETARDTNGNSLETIQNVGIEPDRTNENPKSIPEPNSCESVPEPNSSESIPEPNT